MLRSILATVLLFVAGYALAVSGTVNPAPELSLANLQGQRVTLNSMKGKVVLVNFWASWCPPCREEMPSIWRLHRKTDNDEFVVLLVNEGETAETIKAFLPSRIRQDLVSLRDADGSAARSWGAVALPHSFLVDKNGQIRFQYRGARKWDSAEDIARVKALLK